MRLSLLCAVVAAGLCVVTAAAPVPDLAKLTPDEQFDRFKQQFNKVYSSPEEENDRREVFKANLAQLSMSNDATVGVTKFSDLTDDEFAQRYLGLRPSKNLGDSRFWDSSCPACKRFPELAAAAPSSFDWTTKGAVTAVKTQNCGDCYAFASTGDIEGSWFLAGNDLTPLSEEQIIDCCYEDMGLLECAGCAGGEPHDVFDWLIQKEHGGICDEQNYPYTVPKHQPHPGKCQRGELKNSTFSARISSWYWVSRDASGESNITTQLPKVGPIGIGIDALNAKMKAYTGGIAQPDCPKGSTLNHAVLIVGYGTEGGVDYWKIKNSWGTDWGEDGYYRVVRGKNACGIAEDATHSVV